MNALQIETWAIHSIDNLLAGKPNEDSKVEFKATWPKPVEKAARQIAAHANAARGDPILWIIGADQKNKSLIGAEHKELSEWYEQIRSFFDERHAPSLKDINFTYENVTIVALFLDTERFPYVVKHNNDFLEVPWREGTNTRSARRFELLKLLLPLVRTPRIEILKGELSIINRANGGYWNIHVVMYIEPYDNSLLTIPFHRSHVNIEIPNANFHTGPSQVQLAPPHMNFIPMGRHENTNLSKTIESTPDELLVYGPGKILLNETFELVDLLDGISRSKKASITISLLPTGIEYPVLLNIPMRRNYHIKKNRNGEDVSYMWSFEL